MDLPVGPTCNPHSDDRGRPRTSSARCEREVVLGRTSSRPGAVRERDWSVLDRAVAGVARRIQPSRRSIRLVDGGQAYGRRAPR